MENQFILTESFKNKYGGVFFDIDEVIKDLCKKFGKELGWECTNSYSARNLEFRSGTWSSRVTITVKISKTGIYIKCITNGKPLELKDKENCEIFLSLIVPRIERYLITKESERLVKEKILNSEVETIEKESEKSYDLYNSKMMKILEYKLVTKNFETSYRVDNDYKLNHNIKEFEKSVKIQLDNGFTPLGGVSVSFNERNTILTQTLVRYEK